MREIEFNDWVKEFNVSRFYCQHKPFEDRNLVDFTPIKKTKPKTNWNLLQLIAVVGIGLLIILKTIL